jgi:hypothetical protein
LGDTTFIHIPEKNNDKMIYIAPDLHRGALGAGKTLPQPPYTPKRMRQIHNNNIA